MQEHKFAAFMRKIMLQCFFYILRVSIMTTLAQIKADHLLITSQIAISKEALQKESERLIDSASLTPSLGWEEIAHELQQLEKQAFILKLQINAKTQEISKANSCKSAVIVPVQDRPWVEHSLRISRLSPLYHSIAETKVPQKFFPIVVEKASISPVPSDNVNSRPSSELTNQLNSKSTTPTPTTPRTPVSTTIETSTPVINEEPQYDDASDFSCTSLHYRQPNAEYAFSEDDDFGMTKAPMTASLIAQLNLGMWAPVMEQADTNVAESPPQISASRSCDSVVDSDHEYEGEKGHFPMSL